MKHRFRSVEIAIFCLVSLAFAHSLYGLFKDDGTRKTPTRTGTSPLRMPAQVPDRVIPYTTHCKPNERFVTQANRIIISGPYCGSSDKTLVPTSSNATNLSTGINATILNIPDANQFSTDYILLKDGLNKILIEFEYPNSKNFKVNLSIQKD
jgi:hypothetical protein